MSGQSVPFRAGPLAPVRATVTRTLILLVKSEPACKACGVKAIEKPSPQPIKRGSKGVDRLFYRIFLPLGVLTNVALAVIILAGLRPDGWTGWLQVGTGAFCCLVAGWLAAAAWSKSYWNRTMTRQVTMWQQIADTFFKWLEDAPLTPEAVRGLKSSLDKVVPASDRQ